MSYSCSLKANRDILEKDIDSIVENLPEKFSAFGGNCKQSWGWHCGCDVYIPKEEILTIGGSYSISGNIADDFVAYFKDELQKLNYNIYNVRWDW